jgi:phage repressor protein C with HTH and peptisase S24 domain
MSARRRGVRENSDDSARRTSFFTRVFFCVSACVSVGSASLFPPEALVADDSESDRWRRRGRSSASSVPESVASLEIASERRFGGRGMSFVDGLEHLALQAKVED